MPDINFAEVFFALVLSAVVVEITDWLPKISERIIKLTAKRHPTLAQEREIEWLAALDEIPGKWSQLWFALTCVPSVIVKIHSYDRSVSSIRAASLTASVKYGEEFVIYTRVASTVIPNASDPMAQRRYSREGLHYTVKRLTYRDRGSEAPILVKVEDLGPLASQLERPPRRRRSTP